MAKRDRRAYQQAYQAAHPRDRRLYKQAYDQRRKAERQAEQTLYADAQIQDSFAQQVSAILSETQGMEHHMGSQPDAISRRDHDYVDVEMSVCGNTFKASGDADTVKCLSERWLSTTMPQSGNATKVAELTAQLATSTTGVKTAVESQP